jgi:amidophosphoribosyltransferase
VGWVIASESCAVATVGAEFVREVQPGEMVVCDGDGMRSVQVLESPRRAMCIFEFIYFARPDSSIYGRNVYMARVRMGQALARQSNVEADLVVPIPETGIPAAIGYAQESHRPFGEALIKNRYIFRTFINPDQRMRDMGVKMKLSPLTEAIAGRRLVVVDDSIVRGTTTRPEVELLKAAGAREIHLRITCPPIRYPCFYGIDTSAGHKELIAARLSVEAIRAEVGADTLEYQTMENMVRAVGLPQINFCTACFDGEYPIEVPPEVRVTKFDLERDRQPA